MHNISLRTSSSPHDKRSSFTDDLRTTGLSVAPRGTTPRDYQPRSSSAVSKVEHPCTCPRCLCVCPCAFFLDVHPKQQSVSDSTLAMATHMTPSDLRDLRLSAISRTPSREICAAQVQRVAQWRHFGRQYSIDRLTDDSDGSKVEKECVSCLAVGGVDSSRELHLHFMSDYTFYRIIFLVIKESSVSRSFRLSL